MNTNTIEFSAPTRILSSENLDATLSDIVELEHAKRVVMLIDRNVFDSIAGQVMRTTRAANVVQVPVDAREPDTDMIDEFAQNVGPPMPDLIVGIGGGSIIDLAKAVSVVAFNAGHAAEYQGRNLVPNPGCNSVMVPTTAGTGSEVTPGAVVTNPATKRKGAISSPFVSANYAILAPDLVASVPGNVAAMTGMDALAHSIESYTACCATLLSKMYSREAFRLIVKCLPAILNGDRNKELLLTQQIAATMAGIAICNSDTGAAHAMSYPLGIYFKVPHGLAVSLLIPRVMEVNIQKGCELYAELAAFIPGVTADMSDMEKSERLQRFVDGLVSSAQMSGALEGYGVSATDVAELSERSLDLKTALLNNPVEFSREDAEQVLGQLLR